MRTRASSYFVCTVCLLAFAVGPAPGAEDETAGWPRYAHDPALTGRSPLHGNIVQPQTRWSYSTAGRELVVEIVPAKAKHVLRLGATQAPALTPATLARPGPPMLDLEGSRTLHPAAESNHERWGSIL